MEGFTPAKVLCLVRVLAEAASSGEGAKPERVLPACKQPLANP